MPEEFGREEDGNGLGWPGDPSPAIYTSRNWALSHALEESERFTCR